MNYRNYLIRQIEKSGVQLRMSTECKPDMLEAEGFDVVMAAIGASPKQPKLPGVERCFTSFETLGHEEKLGHRCVVIGGSETGTEVGLYLAEHGHEVTVLTRQNGLATDATPIHYRETIQTFYAGLSNFRFILKASAAQVGDGWVEYQVNGKTERIECDSVVALGGMQAHQTEAMAFAGCAGDFYMLGDCRQVGNIHTGSRDAFFAAHQF